MSYKTSDYILKTKNNDGELILKNTLTQMMLKVRECDIENTENVLQTPKV